jgi:hypothetical protein
LSFEELFPALIGPILVTLIVLFGFYEKKRLENDIRKIDEEFQRSIAVN